MKTIELTVLVGAALGLTLMAIPVIYQEADTVSQDISDTLMAIASFDQRADDFSAKCINVQD